MFIMKCILQVDGGGMIWTGAKVTGLVLGLLLLIAIILLVFFLLCWKRRKYSRKPKQPDTVSQGTNVTIMTQQQPTKQDRTIPIIHRYVPTQQPHSLRMSNRLHGALWGEDGFYRDPYDSEEDTPLVFAYEGEGRPASEAGSLSSLDSEISHFDDLELQYIDDNLVRLVHPYDDYSDESTIQAEEQGISSSTEADEYAFEESSFDQSSLDGRNRPRPMHSNNNKPQQLESWV